MKSKTIIISSQNNGENSRGILTIFMEDDLLKCKLRLYNITTLNRYCKLGIYHQNEVYSANLLEKNGSYTSSFVGNFDIEKDFYTAIIDTSNNNNVILCGGTYSGFFFNNQSVFDQIEKENPNTNLVDYEEEINNIESLSNTQFNTQNETNIEKEDTFCNKCETCKYKEFFYSQKENFSPSTINTLGSVKENSKECLHATNIAQNKNVIANETRSSQNISQNAQETQLNNVSLTPEKSHSILNSIIPQFEYVFENYKADETLNNLIPNGKFVKINENQEQFSIGAIYENENMKYICYAVLKDYNSEPPQELGEHYQWLPLDKEDPLSEGYYIVFQDANDLKIVEM